MNYYEFANRVINLGYGISHTYLKLKLMGEMNPTLFSNADLMYVIHHLVAKGEIVKLTFTIHGESQTLYFPKGTTIEREKEVSNSISDNESCAGKDL